MTDIKISFSAQTIKLSKQNNSLILDNAIADGYVKAIILGNSKKIIAGNLNIAISEKAVTNFKGEIGDAFELSAFGDCMGGGGDETNDETDPCRRLCRQVQIGSVALAYGTYGGALIACVGSGPFYPACAALASLAYVGALVVIDGNYQQCLMACPPTH